MHWNQQKIELFLKYQKYQISSGIVFKIVMTLSPKCPDVTMIYQNFMWYDFHWQNFWENHFPPIFHSKVIQLSIFGQLYFSMLLYDVKVMSQWRHCQFFMLIKFFLYQVTIIPSKKYLALLFRILWSVPSARVTEPQKPSVNKKPNFSVWDYTPV